MEKYLVSCSLSDEYDNSDEDDCTDDKVISTCDLLEQAEEIVVKLQHYTNFNGLNLLTSNTCTIDMVDLIDIK